MQHDENGPVIYTIGHSTRPLDEFISMLQAHSISRLIDVRTVPRSARNPQFNRESLPEDLAKARIQYEHLPALGGLRKPRPDSVNTGWKNESFRGYADYMQTPEFVRALERLIGEARIEEAEQANDAHVCIMCAEAVPWRCHRSLVSDALLARGIRAMHIMSAKAAQPHNLTSFARVRGERVTYPAESLDFGEETPGD
jgi:uncharacterized protein (DUF488 family)